MKKNKLLALALFSGITGFSYAQSSGFEGAYGRIGVGYSTVNLNANATATVPAKYGNTNLVTSQSFDNIGTLIGDIGFGYNFRVAPQFLLGVGFGILPSASATANYSLSTAAGTVSGTSQLKNPWSIYVAPGYELSKDQLIYGKVGYTGVTGVTSDPTFGANSTTYSGYLLGLGFNMKFQDNMYGFVEYNYTNYSSATSSAANVAAAGGGTVPPGYMIGTSTSQPVAQTFLVGVGYRF
jgi:opacity protein-like surface antigen